MLRHIRMVDESVDEVISLINRAADAGYVGIVLAAFRFSLLCTPAS